MTTVLTIGKGKMSRWRTGEDPPEPSLALERLWPKMSFRFTVAPDGWLLLPFPLAIPARQRSLLARLADRLQHHNLALCLFADEFEQIRTHHDMLVVLGRPRPKGRPLLRGAASTEALLLALLALSTSISGATVSTACPAA